MNNSITLTKEELVAFIALVVATTIILLFIVA